MDSNSDSNVDSNIDSNMDSNNDDSQCLEGDDCDGYLFDNDQYNVDLHNDPSKYLLLSSLFKTLDNTEICEFLALNRNQILTGDGILIIIALRME